MAAYSITIIWKSFEPVFPDVISERLFNNYKSSEVKKFITVEFLFLEAFRFELITIFLGTLAMLADIYHWFPLGGWVEIIAAGVLIIAFFVLISFILSAISFISSYFHSKKYIHSLNNILSDSDTYKTFCIAMSDLDKRYIMQIQRIENDR